MIMALESVLNGKSPELEWFLHLLQVHFFSHINQYGERNAPGVDMKLS